MTNREMLFKIQSVESLISHIKERAEIKYHFDII